MLGHKINWIAELPRMTFAPQALVVLLDPEDVHTAFPDWPSIVCLAVCLMRSGEFSTLLFHRNERMEIPTHIVDLLGLDDHDVCFVPKVPGFATRPFLYSDERRLMALIGLNSSVLDEATDYMVNYTYAMEEGLDPALLLGRPSWASIREPVAAQITKKTARVHAVLKKPPAPVEPAQKTKPELSPILPEFLRRSAEQHRALRFSTVRTVGVEALAATS